MLLGLWWLGVAVLGVAQGYWVDLAKRNANSSEIWDYSYTSDMDSESKIRGVSLGGWFVLEPYITPSLFEQFLVDGITEAEIPFDEYSFTEALGKNESLSQLEAHWSSFITEDDFPLIKSYGLNLVRIPIGYWAFKMLDDDPYVSGAEKYLDQALQWARDNDLKAWIDLHGVPGSQNGFDNSGKRGNVTWQATKENINLTIEVLDYIFSKYGGNEYSDTVIGIEIVNEPLGADLDMDEYLEFAYKMYGNYRNEYNSSNYFLIHDAFEGIGYWDEHFNNAYRNVSSKYCRQCSNRTDYYGVVVDHHHYEVFTDYQNHNSEETRISDIQNFGQSLLSEQKHHPSLVGEWSGALTDCQKWLNGVNVGSRYDGTYDAQVLQTVFNETAFNETGWSVHKRDSTGYTCENKTNLSDFSELYKANIRKFIEVQVLSYEKYSAGWIFWNYKTEDAIEWDMQKLVDSGLFPQPLNNFTYFYENGTEIALKSNPKKKSFGVKHSTSWAHLGASIALLLLFV